MIDPVASKSTEELWAAYNVREAELAKIAAAAEADTRAAEEEVVSLWYMSSIKSLQDTTAISAEMGQPPAADLSINNKGQSRFQKVQSWLKGLFGWGKEAEKPENHEKNREGSIVNSSSKSLSDPPKLQALEISNEKLSKAIAELNKEFLQRIKDTAEFEAEMRKSNSKAMDRLILIHTIFKSQEQKKLKEAAGLEIHEHILKLQEDNKKINRRHYAILDDINAAAKTQKILHWVNIGTTVGIVGTMAIGFATGGAGAVLNIALPTLNIIKGGFSAGEGILKYKNDSRTGELTVLNNEAKSNRNNINDKVNATLPAIDEEISHVLKNIRHHLENHGKEARMNPQN